MVKDYYLHLHFRTVVEIEQMLTEKRHTLPEMRQNKQARRSQERGSAGKSRGRDRWDCLSLGLCKKCQAMLARSVDEYG